MAGSTKAPKKDSGIKVDVKSTHQKYLEEVLDPERKAPTFFETVNPSKAVTDDGYIGTDPIYQNAANETEEPHQADEGPDKLAEDFYVKSVESEGGNEAGDALKENFSAVSRAGGSKEVETDSSDVSDAGNDDADQTADQPKS